MCFIQDNSHRRWQYDKRCNVVTQTVQSLPQCPTSSISTKHVLQWKEAQPGATHCSRYRISYPKLLKPHNTQARGEKYHILVN